MTYILEWHSSDCSSESHCNIVCVLYVKWYQTIVCYIGSTLYHFRFYINLSFFLVEHSLELYILFIKQISWSSHSSVTLVNLIWVWWLFKVRFKEVFVKQHIRSLKTQLHIHVSKIYIKKSEKSERPFFCSN